MYLVGLHGHGTSLAPASSGAPTECTHGTNSPSSPSTSYTLRPMRVMMRMLVTTYGLSLSSTPICAIGEPSGPIENGTTYMVRPRIEPSKRPSSVVRISSGATQLLVGPASSRRCAQMKVRSSTRATSEGSDHARYEFGRFAGLSFLSVPASTICAHRRSYSSCEPSHHTMLSGRVIAATRWTQSISFRCFTHAGASTAAFTAGCASNDGRFIDLSPFVGIGKRYRPGDAACERHFVRCASFYKPTRNCTGHHGLQRSLLGQGAWDGRLQPSVKRLACTLNKLLKTMSIGLAVALSFYAVVATVRHSAKPACDLGHMMGQSA